MEYLLQVVLVTVVLTLIGGVSQLLPWGIGSARQVSQQTAEFKAFGSKRSSIVNVEASPVVTEEFDRVMVDQVTTLTTDRSFSWIVSKPLGYYSPGRYLGREVLTQLLVAIAIVTINALLGDTPGTTKILIVLIAAALTAVASYGQLVNWWGLTVRYFVGVALTMVVGWGIAIGLISLIWP